MMQQNEYALPLSSQQNKQQKTLRVRDPDTGKTGILTEAGFVPDTEPESFLSTMAKEIVRTPLRFAATGLAAVEGATRLAAGDVKGANKVLKEGYNMPLVGQLKPYRVGKDIGVETDATGKQQMTGGGFGKETS